MEAECLQYGCPFRKETLSAISNSRRPGSRSVSGRNLADHFEELTMLELYLARGSPKPEGSAKP